MKNIISLLFPSLKTALAKGSFAIEPKMNKETVQLNRALCKYFHTERDERQSHCVLVGCRSVDRMLSRVVTSRDFMSRF